MRTKKQFDWREKLRACRIKTSKMDTPGCEWEIYAPGFVEGLIEEVIANKTTKKVDIENQDVNEKQIDDWGEKLKFLVDNCSRFETGETIPNDMILILNLVDNLQRQAYDKGYKQGVEDEVRCIEESGEHGEAVKKFTLANIAKMREMVGEDSQLDEYASSRATERAGGYNSAKVELRKKLDEWENKLKQ